MNQLIYTVAEVAKILKVNKHYVYALIKSERLPAMKLGSLKISHAALEKFIEESQGKDLTDPYNVTELKK